MAITVVVSGRFLTTINTTAVKGKLYASYSSTGNFKYVNMDLFPYNITQLLAGWELCVHFPTDMPQQAPFTQAHKLPRFFYTLRWCTPLRVCVALLFDTLFRFVLSLKSNIRPRRIGQAYSYISYFTTNIVFEIQATHILSLL